MTAKFEILLQFKHFKAESGNDVPPHQFLRAKTRETVSLNPFLLSVRGCFCHSFPLLLFLPQYNAKKQVKLD